MTAQQAITAGMKVRMLPNNVTLYYWPKAEQAHEPSPDNSPANAKRQPHRRGNHEEDESYEP